MIRYLKHDDIDPDKWDACVGNAQNGLIYGYSFYLDHMAKHWDGLVLGDYEAVMALTWNKKFGIHYLYQPAFTVSCGIFGNQLDEGLIQQFIQSIPNKFRLIEINLNAANIFSHPSGFQHLRTNYTLSLQAPYQELFNNYRQNTKRNIKRATEAGCKVKTDIPLADIIELAKKQLNKIVKIEERDFEEFEKLHDLLLSQQKAVTYGVYNTTGELLASCVYFFSHKRAYYILVGNHPNGKTLGASHFLIDRFIADHAGKDLLLDFEGSDISSLAFFYSSFGAVPEIYPALRINRLPWLISKLAN